MYVESLALKNFRNYKNLDINFSNGINILYGENAQGKTNILEALFIAATTKVRLIVQHMLVVLQVRMAQMVIMK